VNPAMSANTKVASMVFGSPLVTVWLPSCPNPGGVCTFAL
jgi:hypothetical protein